MYNLCQKVSLIVLAKVNIHVSTFSGIDLPEIPKPSFWMKGHPYNMHVHISKGLGYNAELIPGGRSIQIHAGKDDNNNNNNKLKEKKNQIRVGSPMIGWEKIQGGRLT